MPSMQWLNDNKQWIFDGLGAAIIIAILGFFFKRFSGSKKDSNSTLSSQKNEVSNTNTNQLIVQLHPGAIEPRQAVFPSTRTVDEVETIQIKSEKPVSLTRITKLTPKEIRKAINNVPLLMKDKLVKQYDGMAVEWNAELLSANPTGSNSARLVLQVIGENKADKDFAACTVSLDDYKELKIANAGMVIKVVGEIEDVESMYFELKNVKLYFEGAL
jgi:hypothetical protein